MTSREQEHLCRGTEMVLQVCLWMRDFRKIFSASKLLSSNASFFFHLQLADNGKQQIQKAATQAQPGKLLAQLHRANNLGSFGLHSVEHSLGSVTQRIFPNCQTTHTQSLSMTKTKLSFLSGPRAGDRRSTDAHTLQSPSPSCHADRQSSSPHAYSSSKGLLQTCHEQPPTWHSLPAWHPTSTSFVNWAFVNGNGRTDLFINIYRRRFRC